MKTIFRRRPNKFDKEAPLPLKVNKLEPGSEPLNLDDALNKGDVDDWGMAFGHYTVLGPEAVEALSVKAEGFYIDATLGGGGHSRLILRALGSNGRLLAVDQDPEPRRWAEKGWGRNESRLKVWAGNFVDIPQALTELSWGTPDGIVMDLGINSRQLSEPERGFSWSRDEQLDMRLDPDNNLSAWDVVNRYPEKQLADCIWRYGEERGSRRIARFIIEQRKRGGIDTTGQLAALVAKALYRPGPPPRIHPATRTFMALRIEVNREMEVLENFLAEAPKILKPGGRLVVISFHSLEDRLVKEAFRGVDKTGRAIWQPLFKKPMVPTEAEVNANPRSRSAKMRAAILLS